VVEYWLPEKFKVPQIQSYVGIGDPVEHIENLRVHLDMHGTPDEVAFRAFPLILTVNARHWFKRPSSGSGDLFDGMSREFLGQFMAARMRKKPSGNLLTLQKRSGETLKDFVASFNEEKR